MIYQVENFKTHNENCVRIYLIYIQARRLIIFKCNITNVKLLNHLATQSIFSYILIFLFQIKSINTYQKQK